MEVEQIMEEDQSLPLTDENVEKVLDEIRPYLVGEHTTFAESYPHLLLRKALVCQSRCKHLRASAYRGLLSLIAVWKLTRLV